MNILVTGANGFVGKNLIATLNEFDEYNVLKVTRETTESELDFFIEQAEFVFHLAGVNRPEEESEFFSGNVDFTKNLLNKLKAANSKAPFLITSSTQVSNKTPYGRSKKAGEDLVFQYAKENEIKVLVYRLPNLFGKWSKPNYNTVVATFCYKIARDENIVVNDPNTVLNLVYIDDLIEEFLNALKGNSTRDKNHCTVPITYEVKLGDVANLIKEFKESRKNQTISNLNDEFTRKLYSTYLNFLPTDEFSYPLNMHEDNRGSFTEFVKSSFSGQVSINVSKPGITKGEHWHHTKNEKFLVVYGQGVIRFRNYFLEEVIEYYVSGEKLTVVDIPTGYTHSIVNTGSSDMVTVMWVNEIFDPENPDTFFMEV